MPKRSHRHLRRGISRPQDGGADFLILETFSRRESLLAPSEPPSRLQMPYIPSIAIGEQGIHPLWRDIDSLYAPWPEESGRTADARLQTAASVRPNGSSCSRLLRSAPYSGVRGNNAGFPKSSKIA